MDVTIRTGELVGCCLKSSFSVLMKVETTAMFPELWNSLERQFGKFGEQFGKRLVSHFRYPKKYITFHLMGLSITKFLAVVQRQNLR